MTDPTSEMISEALDLGHKSYQDGASRRENPYGMSSDEYLCLAWIRGYNMARTERAISMEFPVGTFMSSTPGGKGGLRKVSGDRWEMISPDGSSTEKFVEDDFARMLYRSSEPELDFPDQEL